MAYNSQITFAITGSAHDIEEGPLFMPKFDSNGLITAIAVNETTNEILMVAHMNRDALIKSIETNEAWYWSRSRNTLWRKGDTSGQLQLIKEIRVDCDQDSIVLIVEVQGDGGCCHTGRKKCFYRRIDGIDNENRLVLSSIKD